MKIQTNRIPLPSELSELGSHVQRLPIPVVPEDSMDLRPPDLNRPLLMIHGLNGHADQWVNLKNWLCTNQNNRYGGIYRAGQAEEFYRRQLAEPGATVFALEIRDNIASPRLVASEVSEALSKIRGATGCQKIDVVTHSMGALDTRMALQQGEESIGKLCMLAPPNQGAYSADLGELTHSAGIYSPHPEGRGGAHEFLKVPDAMFGGVNNPELYQLNQSWVEDRQRLEGAAIVATQVVPTPDRSWTMTNPGDGLVATRRTNLNDTPLYVAMPDGSKPGDPGYNCAPVFSLNHVAMLSQPYVYKFLGEFLAAPEPLQDASRAEQFDLFDGPARSEPEPFNLSNQPTDYPHEFSTTK